MVPFVIPVTVVLLCVPLSSEARRDVARRPPSIVEPTSPRQKFVKTGETVNLQCKAEGMPSVQYEWLWNDGSINSRVIKYDANTGTLQITGITQREEGFFNCKAKNTYQGQEAVAISPKIEVRIARVGDFPDEGTQQTYPFMEGQYAKLPCDENMPIHYGPTTFKWYTPRNGTLFEVATDGRRFIDESGALHFVYIEKADENVHGNREYQCAMSNTIQGLIKLGGKKQVFVNSAGGPIPERKPTLEWSTEGKQLTAETNTNATLECVFSGYTNAGKKVPTVTWFDNADNPITAGGRYEIKSKGQRLIIKSVTQADEHVYYCQGENSAGTARGELSLNVTSPPIWEEPLKDQTVPEGLDATLSCVARSAVGETPPGPPEWYKNGDRMDRRADPTKYVFSDQERKLTIKDVSKETDIACFHCYVENSIGREFSAGCLNVILPITVTAQPEKMEKKVSKGDIVNLTVVATADALTPVKYRWTFKDITYEQNDAPPHVTFNPDTLLAYINTSTLTEEDFATIGGVYRREIYHQYESVYVDVEVDVDLEVDVDGTVSSAGGGSLTVVVVVVVVVLLLVVCVVVFIIWRRRQTAQRKRYTGVAKHGGTRHEGAPHKNH